MKNGKKLVPTVIFALALTLAPLTWAEGTESASSLGPFDCLRAWIVELIEAFEQPATPQLRCQGTDREVCAAAEDGPTIIPSG